MTDPTRVTRTRGCLADEICRRISDEIALGNFPPGFRLDEVSLAERYRVSRTPIREALRQLGSLGLVETRPNRGAIVAGLTPEQLDQIFEAIGEMEAACARHAAVRLSVQDSERLVALHADTRKAMQAGNVEEYDECNTALHELIIQGCGNPVLIELVTGLRNRVAPFRRTQFRNLARMAESYAEHAAIVEALLAHDVVTAYREMRSHLGSAREGAGRVAPSWASRHSTKPEGEAS